MPQATDRILMAIDVNNPFSEDTFITELELDDNAPVIISGPTVTAVDSESAIIEWETDEPSNSIVKYGTGERHMAHLYPQ